ncbi:MAG: hypothetical protein NZ602_02375 [Thermoguttaceae bacterium]|nr:hypothetical protein [Thermoguttaceae bacterium]MDW8037148.1 hypothetical protein [Thermoguttaceae bacterium]
MRPARWSLFGLLLPLAAWAGYLSGHLAPSCPSALLKAQACCCWAVPEASGCPCCPVRTDSPLPSSESSEQSLPLSGLCQCRPTEKYLTTPSTVRFEQLVSAIWSVQANHILVQFSGCLPILDLQTPPPRKQSLQSLFCIWRK